MRGDKSRRFTFPTLSNASSINTTERQAHTFLSGIASERALENMESVSRISSLLETGTPIHRNRKYPQSNTELSSPRPHPRSRPIRTNPTHHHLLATPNNAPDQKTPRLPPRTRSPHRPAPSHRSPIHPVPAATNPRLLPRRSKNALEPVPFHASAGIQLPPPPCRTRPRHSATKYQHHPKKPQRHESPRASHGAEDTKWHQSQRD